MALQQVVEQIVTGLGYDLVEIERSPGGLLRVTIDLPWVQPAVDAPEPAVDQFVTVEDCEKVTRQLQFALEGEPDPWFDFKEASVDTRQFAALPL